MYPLNHSIADSIALDLFTFLSADFRKNNL